MESVLQVVKDLPTKFTMKFRAKKSVRAVLNKGDDSTNDKDNRFPWS